MSGYFIDETYTYTVEESRTDFSGFDDITVCRPKLIYFKVTGLRPNTRHFAYLDKVNVTNYINTSVATISDFRNLDRNDIRRNPGEKYVNETGFPTELGGPTGSIYSNAEGTIEGVFYLQSNAIVNFPTGVRNLAFIDISQLNPSVALSYANGNYFANGGIENYTVVYYNVEKTGTRQVWVDTPDPVPPPVDNGGGGGAFVDIGGGGGGGDGGGGSNFQPDGGGGGPSSDMCYPGPEADEIKIDGSIALPPPRPGSDDDRRNGSGGQWGPATSVRPQPRPDRDGGGNDGGGGGKIICTAMNEAYGFGSFRQKIWLAHSHNIPPEYQIGYHAIFLPLVHHAYGKKTKDTISARALRWWGEGFARRRTADIWAQSRGRKRKLSVIVERKMLESLCFVTGWIIKRTGKIK